MQVSTAPSRTTRSTASLTVMAVIGTLLTAAFVVLPASPAQAANVNIGTIRAQMADQTGQDSGTGGNNCITYAPVGTATTSALVSNTGTSANQAQTGHGSPNNNRCPTALSTSTQSVVGFQPSTVTSADDGQQFLIGRMIHYNNPVYASDEFFNGTINTVLTGFTGTNTLAFPWSLDETPNTATPPTNPANNDLIKFTSQISTVTLAQGGLSFRLVITGFVPVDASATCPSSPVGTPVNEFSTVETTQTHACLYASLQQQRTLTITKTVVNTPPGTPSFGFASTSALAGSPWSNSTFSLGSGGTVTRSLTSGNTVTVTEADPGDDRWSLTNLVCTQTGANGLPQPVPGTTVNQAARQVVLANVPAPPLAAQPGITCTYTNTYTPKSTLTLVKSVASGTAPPNLWTLTATGSAAPPPSGTTISGPSGTAAVTTQRIPAGAYTLTETGTGAAGTGYVQSGDWVCRTTGGTVVPVSNGVVTVPDSAAATTAANVTCTATNRFVTGSLRISKIVDAPTGAYTGGTTKTFAGAYDCGTGYTGSFSALTTAVPTVIPGIPAGRTCTVTETTPTGGLVNASYSWGPATFSAQPVTITDGGTAQVTITNPVVQKFGTLAVTKTVSGPGGFVGGTTRAFPVAYRCVLTSGPTTTGTLQVTTAQSVSPTTPIPAGSVCSFSETLAAKGGDFSDPSYVWAPPPTFTPATVTITDSTTAAVGVTNTYVRELGSLTIAKVVTGGGYVGTGAAFTVLYDCGAPFVGSVTVAAGGSLTISNLPARNTCTVQEQAPSASLLSAAYAWGTPTWSPRPTATIVAGASQTLTLTNPTTAIFGQVRLTKSATGETDGITAGATFHLVATCDNRPAPYTFDVNVGDTVSTPDLPVGTSCTVTETPPTGGLVDASYAWGPPPAAQRVRLTSSGQVIPVGLVNTVVRMRGQLTITKAPIAITGVVDPARTYALRWSCLYGNDAPVTGTATVAAGAASTVGPVFLGSACTVVEDPASLTSPPSATDNSWVWLPVTYTPSARVVVTSSTTPVAVTATNAIKQLTGSFNLTKAVVGTGKNGGYTPGSTFTFTVSCTSGLRATVTLADAASYEAPDLPALTQCTVTETTKPPTPPAYGWDPVQFSVDGTASAAGNAVTFTIPLTGASVQVTATNPITPRTSSVRVTKSVSDQTAGLVAGTTFSVVLNCGPGQLYELDVPANGGVTQTGIPVGSSCTASESSPTSGLLDASFAWDPPTYTPANGTVAVLLGSTAVIGINNPIVRVTAPLTLVKTFTGAQGVIDPARTYPITWSCTYRGSPAGTGLVSIKADPVGTVVATDVPATSICTAVEGALGTPSVDPAFRWETPMVTGTVISAPGPNTVTVANTLTRDSGTVFVRKVVTGATEGYIGGTGENFTLHGSCFVPGHPEIPRRYADGTIANGGEKPITASIGWTCSGSEDTPSQSLLKDESYAWGIPTYTPSAAFVLTRAVPTQVFLAENPIVRVRGSFTITKALVDPNGVVNRAATFTGGWSCQYGTDPAVTGRWSIVPAATPTQTIPGLLLGSVCSVTEDPLGTTGLPDASWTWGVPVIGAPDTVVPGATAGVTVTNTVQRLYAGLQVTKTLVDPQGGVVPGTTFSGVWTCVQGRDTFSERFTVAGGGSTTVFTPAEGVVPATAICSIQEDTQDPKTLVDSSFAWGVTSYAPDQVSLVAGQTATLGMTNTVIRVYSDVTIAKQLSGPGVALVDPARRYTGSLSCQYKSNTPVVSTWSATVATPWLASGILVGSVCAATEDPPGTTGQPVDGDRSYVWLDPVISSAVTVTTPDQPTPPITVTNPIDRLFGTFTVTKTVTGATNGIVDPTAPFPMGYVCTPGSGAPITGSLNVSPVVTVRIGPDRQIPIESTCVLTEPADTLPALQDSAWGWTEPTFTLDGAPAASVDRSVSFVIPEPQEDTPVPNVAVGVTNTVTQTPGAFTVGKSSDPATGTTVAPGSTISYSLTLDSTGTVPVHSVVVTDDLSGVLSHGALVAGSLTPPPGTNVSLQTADNLLVWTVGTVPNGQRLTLTYQVVVAANAYSATLRNSASATGDVLPASCASPGSTDPACSTVHTTPPAPVVPPLPPVPPVTPVLPPAPLPDTGFPLVTVIEWAVLFLAIGVTMVVVGSRRRRTPPDKPAG